MSAALLDLQYLPNISWFKHFLASETIYIEQEENMVKSTYRNRCEITGAGGKLPLTIPVLGGRDHHQLYKATPISNSKPWQHSHWQSIISAYGSAPFFNFYAYKFQPFYEKEYALLFDFNLQLLNALLSALKIQKGYQLTKIYEKEPVGKTDFRSTRASMQLNATQYPSYYQVFEDRTGFIGSLSVLDLIFNEGPQALRYLQNQVG